MRKKGLNLNYKQESHLKLEKKLSEQLKDAPSFVSDYFFMLKSARTKITSWGYLRDMFQFFINKQIINKTEIVNITADDMKNITFIHIIQYLDMLLLERNNSLSTINTKKAVLSGFWDYLVNIQCVSQNVVTKISKSKYKREESSQRNIKLPSKEELDKFSRRIRESNSNDFLKTRNMAIVKLFVFSGIRCEELIGLNMEDLYIYERPYYITVLGKGHKELKEKVYVSQKAIPYLGKYLGERKRFIEERLKTNENFDKTAVFLSDRANRISVNSVVNLFKQYSKNTITPHMLRHYYGTKLYKKTKNIKLVQKQLRHRDIETAAKFYVSVSDEEICAAVEKL